MLEPQLQRCPDDDGAYQLWQDGAIRCDTCGDWVGTMGAKRADRRWLYRAKADGKPGRVTTK